MLTGSLLPLSALLVFGGRLGDVAGRRRVFLARSRRRSSASGSRALGGLARRSCRCCSPRASAQGGGQGRRCCRRSIAIVSAAFFGARGARARARHDGRRRGGVRGARRRAPPASRLLAVQLARGVGLHHLPLAVATILLTRRSPASRRPPTTVPMILVAPLAGRWYDGSGGRLPLATGFGLLAVSGVLLAVGAGAGEYLALLPGLLVYGVGLSLVLTVNDPVTLDSIPADDEGQASGVSATAEQFGGAVGIAVLYSIFHAIYVDGFVDRVDASSLSELARRRRAGRSSSRALDAAQATGCNPGGDWTRRWSATC